MDTQPVDLLAVLTRISLLERQNQRMRGIGLAVLLAVSGGGLMGQAKPQSQKGNAAAWQNQVVRAGTIQCRKVELVTPEGDVRGKLIADRSGFGAALMMFDKDGKPSLSLTSVASPQLIMGDLIEDPFRDGYVELFTGHATVTLSGSSSGGFLYLTDKSGIETLKMKTFGSNPASGSTGSVQLSLVSGAPSLYVGKNGSYHTEIGTTDLITIATGETHRTSAASIVLFDEKGNVIWSAENDSSGLAAANFIAAQNVERKLDDLEQRFKEFKDGACPVLRTARVGELTRMRLDSVCGLN